MTDYFASSIAAWMIAGGPRVDEHDQRVHHLVAIDDARRDGAAPRPAFIERLRSWFAGGSTVETLDCCVA